MDVGSTIILDGGMGKELSRIGAPFCQPEWSAQALMEDPAAVRRAHRNFVEAGAQVITTNAYAVVPFHIGRERFAARGRELAGLAGRLAREAASEATAPVLVAASVPPVFGSYAPERFDPTTAPALLEVLIEAQAPWVDLWLVETLGSTAEAKAAAAALDQAGVGGPRWYSFSVADDRDPADGSPPVLWSGETLAAAAAAALEARADAVLLNCSTPEAISLALTDLVAALGDAGSTVAVGAYANAFPARPDSYAPNEVILGRRADLTPAAYADLARGWIEAGATIVGGCCGIHPEHIAELARRVPVVPGPADPG